MSLAYREHLRAHRMDEDPGRPPASSKMWLWVVGFALVIAVGVIWYLYR